MSIVCRLLPHSCTQNYLSFSSISLVLRLICSFSHLLYHLFKVDRYVCQESFFCLSLLLHTIRCGFKDAFIRQILCYSSILQLSSCSNLPSSISSFSLIELMIHLLRKNSRSGIEKLFRFRYHFNCIPLHFFFVSYLEIF